MRYIVEQWNALLEWLGTGKKVMLGIIFLSPELLSTGSGGRRRV